MENFNPLKLSNELKDLYKEFILTSFPLKNKVLLKRFVQIIAEDKLLWNGPFISAASRYKRGENAKNFLNNIGFNDNIINSLEIDRLYEHQQRAIESIKKGNNTILSTGTGSGKTESFILPILDYCINNREKGLKAIIVYPMNALANDQILRLRTLLYKINSNLKNPITICKYTGQTPQNDSDHQLEKIPEQKCKIDKSIFGDISFPGCPDNCDQMELKPGLKNNKAQLICKKNENYENNFELLTRDEIRKNTPDILITNYVQLEYLLLRRADSNIFKSSSMKFLVFDEVHWYSGATGAEVSLLIRRLKSRIKKYSKEKIVCIGTSATISSEDKALEEISKFASNIFGEEINSSNIIIGEKEPLTVPGGMMPSKITIPPIYNDSDINEMDDNAFNQYCNYFLDTKNNFTQNKLLKNKLLTIGQILSKNQLFKVIIENISLMPKNIDNLVEVVSSTFNLEKFDNEYIKKIIWAYLYIGSIAYNPISYKGGETEPLIKPQLHIFFKTIGDNWPLGEIFTCIKCGELYSKSHEKCINCGGSVEELCICRFCGEEFYRCTFEKNPLDTSLKVNEVLGLDTTINTKKMGHNLNFPTIFQSFKDPEKEDYIKQKKCIVCGSLNSESNSSCVFCNSSHLKEIFLKENIHNCPACGRSYGKSGAVSTMYMSPNTTSKVVFDLNYLLLPDKERKMIIFTDSRQDASYISGTIKDEHLDHLIRQLLTQIIMENNGLTYHELESEAMIRIQKLYPDLKSEEIRFKLLTEVTSITGRQRSTENLGLISISYLNLENLDLKGIADNLEISEEIFKKYLINILNIIRQQGALEGLNNIKIFRNPPTGFICERGTKKESLIRNLLPSKYPTYNNRFTEYTKKVFENKDILKIIEASFEALRVNGYLKEANIGYHQTNTKKGFIINRDKLRFTIPENVYKCNYCGRIQTISANNECTGWKCNGKLEPVEVKEFYSSNKSFYLNFYRNIDPVRLNVKEDTGSVFIDERQRRELEFRTGNIDLLVATPTLELGIDIGDLSCIGLMKSPPSPANYVQRVGRAGRKSNISMANSFMFINPLDLYYFDSPHEMINGNVMAPQINLENQYILQRHIYSLILEELLVTPSETPQYHTKPFKMNKFIDGNNLELMLDKLNLESEKIILTIKSTFADLKSINELDNDVITLEFENTLRNSIKSYDNEFDILDDIISEIDKKKRELRRSSKPNTEKELKRLTRMEYNINYRYFDLNRRDFFSYLSKTGAIPRYAFPGEAVKVISSDGYEYDSRQMPIALYELAPGMPVYLNGMKNEVIGIPFGQDPEMIKTTSFFICENCGIYANEIEFDKCPECGAENEIREIKDCYKPTIVVVEIKGKPSQEGRDMLFVDSEAYLLQPIDNLNSESSQYQKTDLGEIKLLDNCSILIVIKGISDYDSLSPKTFNLCESCGYSLGGNFSKVEESKRKKHMDLTGRGFHEPSGVLENIKLYHKFDTPTLLITLPEENDVFLTTFKNALINSAQRIVGAEDGEIDGIIKQNKLILYDNIEGGAGYVNTIFNKFDEILDEVINLILSCSCDKGCIKCIYSYRRRNEIRSIDKKEIIGFIKELKFNRVTKSINTYKSGTIGDLDILKPILNEFNIPDDSNILISNRGSYEGSIELRDAILTAKDSIYVLCDEISNLNIDWNDGKSLSWVDIFIAAKINGADKIIVLVNPMTNEKDKQIISKLQRRGIRVRILNEEYAKKKIKDLNIIIIDEKTPNNRCILHSADLSPNYNLKSNYYIFLNKNKEHNSYNLIIRYLNELIKGVKN